MTKRERDLLLLVAKALITDGVIKDSKCEALIVDVISEVEEDVLLEDQRDSIAGEFFS